MLQIIDKLFMCRLYVLISRNGAGGLFAILLGHENVLYFEPIRSLSPAIN